MVNRGVQQSGDVPHGWRRDGVSKTSELPTREELLRRMWSLASARANDAVKLAFLPEEQMGAIGKLDLAALTELKRENAKLEHAYRTALDLDTVQEKAEAMGMIPAEEAEKMTVRVSVPEHEEEPTAWENFLWFLSGLLGPAEEPES